MKTIYKLLFIAMAMTLFTGCYGAHDELKDFAESFEETDVE